MAKVSSGQPQSADNDIAAAVFLTPTSERGLGYNVSDKRGSKQQAHLLTGAISGIIKAVGYKLI